MLSKQSQTEAWLNKVDAVLSQILLAIQAGMTSTPPQLPIDTETRTQQPSEE